MKNYVLDILKKHNKLSRTMKIMKTTKSEKKVKRKQDYLTMKKTTMKFQFVSKFANYLSWDEKQNAPSHL